MLEQKCKKHWITFTNTYAGTVVLEQSEQFEFFSDIPTSGSGQCQGYRSKRRQVGSATNKMATRRNGDNLNGDNYSHIGDR